MSDEKYNGWSNWETWCVKLWLDNSEGDYNYWNEAAREALSQAGEDYEDNNEVSEDPSEEQKNAVESDAADRLSERLKDELVDNAEGLPENGMYSDLLTSSLGRVDWREIAKSMIQDQEE